MSNYKFNAYDNKHIKEAFDTVIKSKLEKDKYINLTKYIRQSNTKQEYYNILNSVNSNYKYLFSDDQKYPKNNNILLTFYEALSSKNVNLNDNLSFIEADAIVYWVYASFGRIEERISFSNYSLFTDIYSKFKITTLKEDKMHVYYDSNEVDINVISSLNDFHMIISNLQVNGHLFFRGHENMNYLLQPSFSRNKLWVKNENSMFEEIQIECPYEFESHKSHLEKLVKMQHYNIPTRLLDITEDPNVALYFSCANNNDEFGEVIVFSSGKYDIKYPQSDTASIYASLAALSLKDKNKLIDLVKNTKDNYEFNKDASVLIQQIRLEKPAFLSEIDKEEFYKVFIVKALKNNNRIKNQNGAFIICGLDMYDDGFSKSINNLRHRNTNDKIQVLLINNKYSILKSLETILIDEASLFPEIDVIAKVIKKRWSKLVW